MQKTPTNSVTLRARGESCDASRCTWQGVGVLTQKRTSILVAVLKPLAVGDLALHRSGFSQLNFEIYVREFVWAKNVLPDIFRSNTKRYDE
jgi:hypothetical protein